MSYENITLGKLLEKRTEEFGDKTYLLFGGKEFSYREMNEKVNQIANALLRAGVKKGVPVNLHMINCPEFVFTFLAAAKIGAVLTPSNIGLTKMELGYVVNHCEAVIAITQPLFSGLFKA